MPKPLRLYLSGPMTGLPECNYPAFHRAAAILRSCGHQVENPAENNIPKDAPYGVFMRAAVDRLCKCDMVVLLPGHETSLGSQLEVCLAQVFGMPVQFFGDETTWTVGL